MCARLATARVGVESMELTLQADVDSANRGDTPKALAAGSSTALLARHASLVDALSSGFERVGLGTGGEESDDGNGELHCDEI